MPPKTTAEHHRDLSDAQKRIKREAAEFRRRQALEERVEDLRDDTISIIRNSGMSFEEIHEKFGPTPGTLNNWLDKKVSQPKIGKMRSALKATGHDIGIIDAVTGNRAAIYRTAK